MLIQLLILELELFEELFLVNKLVRVSSVEPVFNPLHTLSSKSVQHVIFVSSHSTVSAFGRLQSVDLHAYQLFHPTNFFFQLGDVIFVK